MQIEVTLAELNNVVDSLNNFIEIKIPAKYAFRFGRIAKNLQTELASLKEHRNDLYRKHGEEKSDGTLQIPESNMQEFYKEVEELLSEKIMVDFEPMPISLLGDSNVSIATMAWLENFFIDDLDSVAEEGNDAPANEQKEEAVSAGA